MKECFLKIHKWEAIDYSYTPPQSDFKVKKASEDTIRALTEGVTHVYMRCSFCGDLKEKRLFSKMTHRSII